VVLYRGEPLSPRAAQAALVVADVVLGHRLTLCYLYSVYPCLITWDNSYHNRHKSRLEVLGLDQASSGVSLDFQGRQTGLV
jgi:hypothetical protein